MSQEAGKSSGPQICCKETESWLEKMTHGVASSQVLAPSALIFSSADRSSSDAQPLPWYSGRVAMALKT